MGVRDDDDGCERRKEEGTRVVRRTGVGLPLGLASIQLGLGVAQDRPFDPLQGLRVLTVRPDQAADRGADGPDLGGVAAAVRAHQQMESECEASPPRRGAEGSTSRPATTPLPRFRGPRTGAAWQRGPEGLYMSIRGMVVTSSASIPGRAPSPACQPPLHSLQTAIPR